MYCFICKEKISEENTETLRYVFVAENENTGDKTYFCCNCVVDILADSTHQLLEYRNEILFRKF